MAKENTVKSYEDIFNEVLTNKLNDGSVEKIIGEKLEESFTKVIDSCFGYSSDAYSLLKKKIETLVVNAINTSDFDTYMVKITDVLNMALKDCKLYDHKTMVNNLNTLLTDEDKVEFGSLVPLQDIINKYKDFLQEWYSGEKDNFNDEDIQEDEGCYAYVRVDVDIKDISSDYSSTKRLLVTLTNNGPDKEGSSVTFDLIKYTTEDKFTLYNDYNYQLRDLRHLPSINIYLSKLRQKYCKIDLSSIYDSDYVYDECFDEEIMIEFDRY